MTATPHLTASLHSVLQAATLAPSVHNTQPWRFAVREDGFDLLADPHRRLPVLDPSGRQLHLSCGAALVTARTAARAHGLDAEVELLPGDGRALARLRLVPGAAPTDDELALALAVLKRHTVRAAFDARPVPEELVQRLRLAAEGEGAALRRVRSTTDLVALTALLSRADRVEEHDERYRSELASWLRGPGAASADGVPHEALGGRAVRGSSLRLRDFLLRSPERSSGAQPPAERPEVVVLTTAEDGRRAWLEAGQALGLLLLRAASEGVQAQPLGQVVDLSGPRWALKAALGLTGVPQMVLRLGYATAHATTPRRDLADVVV